MGRMHGERGRLVAGGRAGGLPPSGANDAVPVSAIVPALDEAAGIGSMLRSLEPLREWGGEVIVVDGGSGDETVAVARAHADRVVVAARGRAHQMNAGARHARGELLWFLHADTSVDAQAIAALLAAQNRPELVWGRFGVRLDSQRPLLRLTARLMNLRSRLTGIATGDQGVFVQRRVFDEIGGFPEQPLMEDVAISAQLRARARPCCLPVGLTTSARRWQEGGAWRTILLMWRLRFAYWRGVEPTALALRYQRRRT